MIFHHLIITTKDRSYGKLLSLNSTLCCTNIPQAMGHRKADNSYVDILLSGPSGETAEKQEENSDVKDVQATSQAKPAKAPVKRTWPSGFKRPVGRPRKDGRPPIPRKKRRGRRKRKRIDDDEDFPGRNIKIQKDECIPSVEDMEKFPFKCDVCEKIFPTQTWHDFHHDQHNDPMLTYLVCALCDEAFKFLTGK